jgi:uncharacterized protein (TIGR02757 family)
MSESHSNIKDFLDAKVFQYQKPEFIETDPIQIPKKFDQINDIEIVGFLTATLAWGNRTSIIKSAEKIVQIMEYEPFEFIMDYTVKKSSATRGFKHRTFNESDLHYFFLALNHVYKNHGGLFSIFNDNQSDNSILPAISVFKKKFFELPHDNRIEKHVADPEKGSAAKRINMMLRWFVRKDPFGVELGIWNPFIPPAILSCPLDVHSGNVARKLGLLRRNANDRKALDELDFNLRKFDPVDPVKYDFALFGLGVFEGF